MGREPIPGRIAMAARRDRGYDDGLRRPRPSRPGVFARLVPALVFKTSGGCEQRPLSVRFRYTPARFASPLAAREGSLRLTIRLSPQRVDLQHLVAEVVDDLHRNLARLRPAERLARAAAGLRPLAR